MQVSAPNNIKIYNLSSGKSIPDVSIFFHHQHTINNTLSAFFVTLTWIIFKQWLSDRKKRALLKKSSGTYITSSILKSIDIETLTI